MVTACHAQCARIVTAMISHMDVNDVHSMLNIGSI